MRFIDPDGMAVEEINGGVRYTGEDAVEAFKQIQAKYGNKEEEDGDDSNGWPTKGMEIHQTAIKNYFAVDSKGKSKEEKAKIKIKEKALTDAALEADSEKYQGGENSYMHAMRDEGQSVETAKMYADGYVRQKFAKARELLAAGKIEEAYREFGLALHTLQDATSPAHNGFQVWTGEETSGDRRKHNMRESFYPGTDGNLQKITNQYLDWFEKGAKTPLPSTNLFNGIQADKATDRWFR